MIPRERLTRQNRGQRRGGEEKYTGGALLGAVSDVSIASCQSRSHDRSHRNTHFPRLLVIR